MASSDSGNLKENKQPYKVKKRRVFKPGMKCLTFLAICMFSYLVISFGTNFNRLHTMQQDVEKIHSQVKELQEKNEQLREQLKMAQSDSFVEKVAREELNLVKPGESRIVPAQPQQQKPAQH